MIGYIEKPFSLSLLETRIKAILKRYYHEISIFKYKEAEVDFVGYTAKYMGKAINVNAKEFEILKMFLKTGI